MSFYERRGIETLVPVAPSRKHTTDYSYDIVPVHGLCGEPADPEKLQQETAEGRTYGNGVTRQEWVNRVARALCFILSVGHKRNGNDACDECQGKAEERVAKSDKDKK